MTKCEVEKKVSSNKSKTYLLPLITKEVSLEFDYLLLNTYIKFNTEFNINNPIGLLYDFEETEAFNEYKNYLSGLSKVIHGCEKGTLFIFEFPEKYINEYNLFKAGKYSEFSTEAKSLIVSYSAAAYKYPPLIEDITGVLWKHKIRREKMEKILGMDLPKDCELASKIIYDDETFKF